MLIHPNLPRAVILLQIVMVSSVTHLVKNHESQLNKLSPKLKLLRPLCNQTVYLKPYSKFLEYSLLFKA